MTTREKVLELRAADPAMRGATIAAKIGVSRQRVDQILRSEGLRTRGNAKIGTEKRAEYRCWWNMLDRCLNPNSKIFGYYGGRGITVCQRWRDFPKFFEDMGQRPSPKHSIDRTDNNGNYEPSNCRWATKTEQMRNRRTVKATVAIAREVRKRHADGESRQSIAIYFEISKSCVDQIIQKVSWKDV